MGCVCTKKSIRIEGVNYAIVEHIGDGWVFTILLWINGVGSNQSAGKSLSEALIFASTNLQYDYWLFIELQVQYLKIPSSNMGRTCWVQKLFLTFRTIFIQNMFSLCSAKRRASDKDLPVFWSLPTPSIHNKMVNTHPSPMCSTIA